MARELQPPADPTEPPPFVHRRVSGAVVIAVLLTLGSVLAGFGWWSHHVEIYRPRQLWGAEHALRIRDAASAKVWLLKPAQDADVQDRISIAGQPYVIVRQVDASHVRGVSDVRRALIADFAFDWDHQPSNEPRWEYALSMEAAQGQTTVGFAPADGQVILIETGAEANVTPVAEFFSAFFRRALDLPDSAKDAR